MAFLDRSKVVEGNIAKAEQELQTAIEAERPEQAGAAIPKDKNEQLPPGDVPAVVDGVDWKERYANLQRWIDKSLKVKHKEDVDNLQAQITKLQGDIKQMVSKASPSNLPETLEEVERLKKENPAAYGAIMKVASEVAESLVEDRMKSLENEVQEIKRVRKQSAEEAAFVQLQKRFPDIDILALEENEEFINWIRTKSKRTQDALFSNKEDVDAAADVLTLYTLEVLDKKPAVPAKKQAKPGAEFVQPKSGAPAITGQDLGYDFTESQLEEMDRRDPRWFERNSEAVEKAMKSGRILLDISDPIGSQRRMAAMGVV